MELVGRKHSGLGGQLVLGVGLSLTPSWEAPAGFTILIYNIMPATSLQRTADLQRTWAMPAAVRAALGSLSDGARGQWQ